jgi:hypothetical protein
MSTIEKNKSNAKDDTIRQRITRTTTSEDVKETPKTAWTK